MMNANLRVLTFTYVLCFSVLLPSQCYARNPTGGGRPGTGTNNTPVGPIVGDGGDGCFGECVPTPVTVYLHESMDRTTVYHGLNGLGENYAGQVISLNASERTRFANRDYNHDTCSLCDTTNETFERTSEFQTSITILSSLDIASACLAVGGDYFNYEYDYSGSDKGGGVPPPNGNHNPCDADPSVACHRGCTWSYQDGGQDCTETKIYYELRNLTETLDLYVLEAARLWCSRSWSEVCYECTW